MFKTLVKANDDLISFCRCAPAFATSGQADCPWCGCGWLFTCVDCRKAFTFARVAETEFSPEDLARRDFLRFGIKDADLKAEHIAAKAEWLSDQIEDLEVGTVCIILDGCVLPVEARDVAFDGWFARHAFDRPPQVAADGDRNVLEAMVGTAQYWLDRERPDRTS